MEEYRARLYKWFDFLLLPIADFLIRFHLTPNRLSIIGLGLNVVSALLIVSGGLAMGGLVFLLAGLIDLFDGTVARRGGLATEFGGFLDSNLDRIAEGIIFAAIAYTFAANGQAAAAGAVVLALTGSFMVSYVRARAEALGLTGKSGIASRFERLLLISAALMTGFVEPAIYLLLIITVVTVTQRMWSSYWQLEEKNAGKKSPR